MTNTRLSVREATEEDVALIAGYWYSATPEALKAMGVELAKLPDREAFEKRLRRQIALPYKEKEAYILVWEADGRAIGHCNLNPCSFDGHAFMHLHIWNTAARHKGMGAELVKLSLPYFFNNMKIRLLYCEPYALNDAPNKTLEKSGFKFVKEYVTTPGSITFEQPVKLWEMKRP